MGSHGAGRAPGTGARSAQDPAAQKNAGQRRELILNASGIKDHRMLNISRFLRSLLSPHHSMLIEIKDIVASG